MEQVSEVVVLLVGYASNGGRLGTALSVVETYFNKEIKTG